MAVIELDSRYQEISLFLLLHAKFEKINPKCVSYFM